MNVPIENMQGHYVFPNTKIKTETNDGRPRLVLVMCGSFNPITFMHLRLMEVGRDWAERQLGFHVIGGILSPVNDAYWKPGLQAACHRLRMCELATVDSDWIATDTWEAQQASFVRSLLVLEHVRLEVGRVVANGDIRVKLMSGADLVESMLIPNVWQQDLLTRLLEEHGVLYVDRPGSDVDAAVAKSPLLSRFQHNLHAVKDWLQSNLSSTRVRENICLGLSVKYLVADEVANYVKDHHLYQAEQSFVHPSHRPL
mmetsp:Transcript_6920/g.10894  ORF Transcript_6920/g.10894 Transcript_6920/m.10894 type:complete len:256 (-) Transcript_6920:41-808(-)